MNMSPTIGALSAALSKAQGMMHAAPKDRENPFFKSQYATLASVIEAIRAPFTANGLAFSQPTRVDESGRVYVTTVLLHSSGEWISGEASAQAVKPDPQGVGSLISYMKRYGLQALVGIASADDDGHAASGLHLSEPKPAPPKERKATPREEPMLSASGKVMKFMRSQLSHLLETAEQQAPIYDPAITAHKQLFGMACMLVDVTEPDVMRKLSETVAQKQVAVGDLKTELEYQIKIGVPT